MRRIRVKGEWRLRAPFYVVENWTVETTGGSRDGNSRPSNSEPRVPASARTRRVGGGSCKWGWEALLRADFFRLWRVVARRRSGLGTKREPPSFLPTSLQKFEKKEEGKRGRREEMFLVRPTEWVWGRQTIYITPRARRSESEQGVKVRPSLCRVKRAPLTSDRARLTVRGLCRADASADKEREVGRRLGLCWITFLFGEGCGGSWGVVGMVGIGPGGDGAFYIDGMGFMRLCWLWKCGCRVSGLGAECGGVRAGFVRLWGVWRTRVKGRGEGMWRCVLRLRRRFLAKLP